MEDAMQQPALKQSPKTAKHTPGPWTASEKDNRGWRSIRSPRLAVPVAEVLGNGLCEDEANARLIAAAPDLLAALKLNHRAGLLRSEISDNRARINDSTRTLTAEYKTIARANLEAAKAELAAIEKLQAAAIAKAEGGAL
jgi:hypothetical protein